MPERFIILPEADADIAEAYLWHERRAPGLGKEFLGVLEAAFAAIRRSPEAFGFSIESFRHLKLRRFPYAAHYEFREGYVVVYAVFQSSRDPKLLRRTLSQRKPKA